MKPRCQNRKDILPHPILKKGDLVHKICFPASEIRPDTMEDPIVSLFPDAPAGQDHNLSEIRTSKIFLSNFDCLSISSWVPWNLQVIPYPSAEITVEEKMPPVLMNMSNTKNTIMIVCNKPVSPKQHIFCVNPVMKNQPSKELMFGLALTLPNPTGRSMSINVFKTVPIHQTWFVLALSKRTDPSDRKSVV